MKRKFIVTITPPTPNGDLHLGHLSGPFLAADVCARMLKQQGHDVLLFCYSDDYQSYMLRKARQLRRDRFALAKLNSKQIQLSLEMINIECDRFLQTAESEAFAESANHYYQLVKQAGQLQKKATKVFYCGSCCVYGYEGLGRTHCNWCGASSDASQCEECARAPDIDCIDHMTCMLCQCQMEPRTVERWIWQLGKNFASLREHYRHAPMRPALRTYLDEMLGDENTTWGITRPGDAGLQLDDAVEELRGQPIHTWFMGLAGYRATLKEYLERQSECGQFSEWWNKDTQLVHFLGFDCSYSHALGYAALQSIDQDAPKPGVCLTNQFLKLDGEDFSTSRGHAVWIRELVAQHPADSIRLFTAICAPENATENFDRTQFEHWRCEVYDRIVDSYHRDFSQASACSGSLADGHAARIEATQKRWQAATSLEEFSISNMAITALEVFETLASTDNLSVRRRYWALFADMIGPLCPDMTLELKTLIHAPVVQPERKLELA
ncbi:methionine--tRNA ligase [Pseudomonas brassicacearum]|uniref:Methionyl/Leucyl tRNA synthetase domain-containing protein n=1 Tax=Pseudomonas brassicacearum TaxID=930166 RepID=A0A423GJG2_9PSED|nr:methionine--tRNA ligase [Pseudomonas brassicacearum]ROM90336.1 hypothetical protein BK658_26775 [Pseudomonas brassicacearum]